MNFTCQRKDLSFGIKTAGRALGSAATLPILAGMRLDVQGDGLIFQATDLERAIRCRIPLGGNAEPHSTILNGEVLNRIVSVLPDETVNFQKTPESNKVEVHCGGTTFDLFTLPLEDYPQLADKPETAFTKLDKSAFQRGIDLTTFAALSTKETSRLSLTGVHLTFKSDGVRMVSTNGYRLSSYDIPLSGGPEGEFLIDANALRDLAGILSQIESDTVEIYQDNSQLFFHTPEVTYMARVMEEEYPDVERVIPKETPIGLNLSRNVFLAALQRCQITTAEESGAVVIQAHGEQLHLSSSSSEKGETEENIQLDKTIEAIKVSFRAEYLIDALKRMNSENITLWLADSESAGLLEPSGEDNNDQGFIYVCMPIRLDM
jgi:DNA polymerase-3 subunit beta